MGYPPLISDYISRTDVFDMPILPNFGWAIQVSNLFDGRFSGNSNCRRLIETRVLYDLSGPIVMVYSRGNYSRIQKRRIPIKCQYIYSLRAFRLFRRFIPRRGVWPSLTNSTMVTFQLLSLLAMGSSVLADQAAFQSHCTSFANQVNLPGVKVNFANYVAGGTNLSLPDSPASCGTSSQSVAAGMCRIAMAVTTSNSSEITLEAWFPRNYTGRFLSTGNGGLSGCEYFSNS